MELFTAIYSRRDSIYGLTVQTLGTCCTTFYCKFYGKLFTVYSHINNNINHADVDPTCANVVMTLQTAAQHVRAWHRCMQ